MISPGRCHQPISAADDDGADLTECRWHRECQHGGGHRDRCAFPVGAKVPRHAPDRLGNDRDGDDLEPVQPCCVAEIAERGDAVAEEDQRQRRRHREADPSRERARHARPQHADDDADLAACWSRQELAQRDDIGVVRLIEPAAALDELGAEEPEMRDRPAEAGQPEPREHAQDFQR